MHTAAHPSFPITSPLIPLHRSQATFADCHRFTLHLGRKMRNLLLLRANQRLGGGIIARGGDDTVHTILQGFRAVDRLCDGCIFRRGGLCQREGLLHHIAHGVVLIKSIMNKEETCSNTVLIIQPIVKSLGHTWILSPLSQIWLAFQPKYGMLVRAGQRYTPARTIMASDNLQELETNFMCDPDADGGFVYTTVEAAINWMHKYSMWPMPMGTSCCAIEYMAASCSRYDISRFGAEVNRYAPRQADFMFICGTITYKMAALVRRIWDQMPAPKWCIACGACACTGGMFRSYSVLQGVDKIVPVDVYISGCPPRPEALLQGLITLQDKIMATDHPLKGFFKEHDLRQAQNAHTIPSGIITQD